MIAWWHELQKARSGARAFKALPRSQRRIVFYAEGRGYWSYFAPVFHALHERGETVIYLTSGEDDPNLISPPEGLRPFYIGSGSARTLLFVDLDADVLVMTTPNLHSRFLKRSPHGVNYVYLHHSLVSTHMVYQQAAFDHFDTVLCAGPHHIAEIRAREKQAGLPAKALVEHGYGRLDAILTEHTAGPRALIPGEPKQVLIAPSWGADALLERHGAAVVEPLMEAGFRVVLRPHPRTRKDRPGIVDEIIGRFGSSPYFSCDEDPDSRLSLAASDVMVSDWSGAALEFALGLERPVLFVDVPRKCLNPKYESLGLDPLEVQIREAIGEVISPHALDQLGTRAEKVCAEAAKWQRSIQEARRRWVFHPGKSGDAAAAYLLSLVEAAQRRPAA